MAPVSFSEDQGVSETAPVLRPRRATNNRIIATPIHVSLFMHHSISNSGTLRISQTGSQGTRKRSGMRKIRRENCPKKDSSTLFLCDDHRCWSSRQRLSGDESAPTRPANAAAQLANAQAGRKEKEGTYGNNR